jgi:hypothetical protein
MRNDSSKAYLSVDSQAPSWFYSHSHADAGINNLKILWYAPNEAKVRITTQKGCLLEMVDTDYPGWHAFIGNKETPIYRVNYAFKGVFVPPGKHVVVFRFDRPDILIGILISAITFFVLVWLSCAHWARKGLW